MLDPNRFPIPASPSSELLRAHLIVRLRLDAVVATRSASPVDGGAADERPVEELAVELREVVKGAATLVFGERFRVTVSTEGGLLDPGADVGPWSQVDRIVGRQYLVLCEAVPAGESLAQALRRRAFLVIDLEDPGFPRALEDARLATRLGELPRAELPALLADERAPIGPLFGAFLYDLVGPRAELLELLEDPTASDELRVELLMRLGTEDLDTLRESGGEGLAEDLAATMLRLLLADEVEGLQSRIREAYLLNLLRALDAPFLDPSVVLDDADERQAIASVAAESELVAVSRWLKGEGARSADWPQIEISKRKKKRKHGKKRPVGEPVSDVPCRVDRIDVVIPRTRPLTPRLGNDNPGLDDTFRSRERSDRFRRSTTLVVMEQPSTDLTLTATTTRPDLLAWTIERASDDNPALGGANDLPTLQNLGGGRARLTLDDHGSFIVRAFCDGDGDGQLDDLPSAQRRRAVRVLKLVIVEARLERDDTSTRPGGIRASFVGRGRRRVLQTRFGRGGGPARRAGIAFDARLVVRGGGPRGRRGLGRVQAGWINNFAAINVEGRYTGGRRITGLFALNRRSASGRYFRPVGPAPDVANPPFVDTTRRPVGRGGRSATFKDSRIRARTNLAVGRRLRVVADDTPKIPILVNHPAFRGSRLQSFRCRLDFRIFLSLWTQQNPQTYVVARDFGWVCDGTFTPNGRNIQITNPLLATQGANTRDPLARARDDAGAETRAPDTKTLFAFDAR